MRRLPTTFEIPNEKITPYFVLRPLTEEYAPKDYEAVMESAPRLRDCFTSHPPDWPREGFTLAENVEDLRNHREEFEKRKAFAYTVLSLDEAEVLGCIYLDPPPLDSDADVLVRFWARQREHETGFEEKLFSEIRTWLINDWPFKRLLFRGTIIAVQVQRDEDAS